MKHIAVSRTALFSVALLIALGAASGLPAQTRTKGKQTSTTPSNSSKTASDAIILEVGREKYTVDQIADAYRKNANRGKSFFELDRDTAMQFLNLYANYRLKVQAALDAGLDKQPEVIEEINRNRRDLVLPQMPGGGYLIERKVVDPAVAAIFKRRADEVKIGVIFSSMRVTEPDDTLRAYRRTVDMLERLKKGADFARMAVDSSNDPGAKQTGGTLYITGGMVFRPLEDAAYSTPVGQVHPEMIKLPGGYVILKVYERFPRVKVRPGHILFEIASPDISNDPSDSLARAQAEAAYRRIRNGEDFGVVAREVSEDRTSAEHGGDLISFYTRSLGFETSNGKLVPEFENALFSLRDGEVSEPFRTRYGYHIVKRFETRTPTFEEEKDVIRTLYKNQFLNEDRAQYVRSVIEKQGFKIERAAFDQLQLAVDRTSTAADTGWAMNISPGLRAQTLYSFRGKSYTVGAWIDSVESRRELRAVSLHRQGIIASIDFLLEREALTEEAKNLEQEYPEFAALMHEFRDGILIFKLEEEMVWNKLNKGYDEEQGKAFHAKNRERYKTEPKLALTEIYLYKESDVKEINAKVRSGVESFDTLAAKHTQRNGYRERAGRWNLSTPKNSELVKRVLETRPNPKVGEILEPIQHTGGGWSIVRVDEVEPVRTMTYEEARSQVQGDYMDQLQKKFSDEWLDTLRLKYRVKVNDQTLRSALSAR